jgi:hypothetical protein
MADHPTAEPRSPSPSQGETPSPAAHLKIIVGPPTSHTWVTAEGSVPADKARFLITALGISACAVTGAAGAALTLYISHTLIWVAVAEIALALVAIVIIALAGRGRGRRSL